MTESEFAACRHMARIRREVGTKSDAELRSRAYKLKRWIDKGIEGIFDRKELEEIKEELVTRGIND